MIYITSVAVFFLMSSSLAMADSNRLLFSGVVLDKGSSTTLNNFTQWLSKKANYPLQSSYKESYQAITDTLKAHHQYLAWTCGAPFVQDHEKYAQKLVAVPLFHGQPTYSSLVITKSQRVETSLLDFKGEVFAYADLRSNSGFVVPSYALKKQGIDIRKHFRFLLHTGAHENSIVAVLNGLADVANVDEYIYVEYLKVHPEAKGKLKVVESFGPFPFTPIVAARGTSPDAIHRLQQVLLSMNQDQDGKRILEQLGLDGFVVKPVSFYQPIKDMLKVVYP